ncbi:MAG: class I SAM-dependent methyltransferase [Candidatus Omnitrophica bacterium]|nr:class I SAM-dependent methyltransferase [Candidatus Omnitrophota bacterium]
MLVAGPMARRGRVLDVGCGAGREAIALARLGYPIVGIDIAAGAIEAARRHAAGQGLDITFLPMAAHDVSPDLGAFDYVLTTVGFYNLIPTRALRVRTLRALEAVLKPEGAMFLAAHWMPPTYRAGLRTNVVDGLRRLYRLAAHETFTTEPGDQLVSVISPASDPQDRVFRHVFFRQEEIAEEIQAAGLRGTLLAEGMWEVRRP